MQTIYKHVVSRFDPNQQALWIPRDAELLKFGEQNGLLCIWVRLDDSEPKDTRRIYIVGTGQPLPPQATKHIGTAQCQDGTVWHAFEEMRF